MPGLRLSSLLASALTLACGDPATEVAPSGGTDSATGTSDPTASSTTAGSTSNSTSSTTAASSDADSGCPANWWDTRWRARIVATVDNTSGTENLPGFAVPLDFGDVDTMGAADDGHDVRVIDAGGEVLPYELETWDSVTGRIVWVRLPTLGAGISDRELTVYFAYPGAEADSGGDVWGDYQGVWHLGDGFQGAMQNSAPPAIDGQITGTTVEVGALAAARRFSPNQPSRIEFDEASYPLFSGWEAMSMSFWIEPDYATDSDWQEDVGRFLSRGGPITLGRTDDNDSDDGQGRIQIDVHFSGGHVAYLNTEIPRQAWSWMVWDYDGSVLRLYRDGQEVGQDTEVGPALESSDNAIIIGGSTDNNALDGLLDEFRVANVSRSPQWYEAQYRAMSGDMVSLGPVERCQ